MVTSLTCTRQTPPLCTCGAMWPSRAMFGSVSIDDLTYSLMRIWKWAGLAGIVGVAALGITAGTVALKRRPREFIDVDLEELHLRLRQRLAEADLVPSVGSVGDSYDNALAETINGLFKAEVIHRRGPWRSYEVVEYATLEWVDWFNNRRLLAPIGYIPPSETEQRYYAQFNTLDVVA